MVEPDYEAWKEIRGRVDSLAHALFLVAGGALSVSIAVLLSHGGPRLSGPAKLLVGMSWFALLYSIVAFAWIKGLLIVQAERHYGGSPNQAKWHIGTSGLNWFLGITGLIAFCVGMTLLTVTAIIVIA